MFKDARDKFLKQVVRGKTFADVGGLWGTVNERVSVAHKYDASELSMIDITEEGGELWHAFGERMRKQGVSDYHCVSSDICAVDDLSFDVVHCSGVLYHHPNPHVLLQALRRATREHLVLSSAVTQEEITNGQGWYTLPPSGVIFVPALNETEREVLATYWRKVGAEAHGITTPVEYLATDFGPWWWLPTATAMAAMATSAGFKLLDEAPIWGGNAHTLLLQTR